MVNKAEPEDFPGRFREVIADPLNLLIARVPEAGTVVGEEVVLHNGIRVPLAGPFAYYGKFSELLVLNRGVHEPLEEFVFQEVLRRLPEAPLMLELGAYWGHYSMWLKKTRPRATAILVEPDAGNLAAGRHNFERNQVDGEFIQAFVGKGQFEVDAFRAARGQPHVDILHVDIQGHERDMLAGARKTLQAADADYLFISTHAQDIHFGIVRSLSELGYRIETSADFDEGTTSHDGFVFASSPRLPRVFDDFAVLGRDRLLRSAPKQILDNVNAVYAAAQHQPAAFEKPSTQAPRWTLDGFRMGVWGALPVLPGLAAFAMAFGIVAARKGFSLADALLMTGTVYAGLTQMVVLETWPAQITLSAGIGIVAVTFLVNLRYALIGTTLRPFLHTSPAYKVYPTLFLLGEPNWLLTLRYHANGGRDPNYLLGSCVAMWVVWVLATIPGYWLGASVGDPRRFGLDLVMPAFFVAMLVPMWKGPRRSLSWIVGGAASVVVYLMFGGYWYVIAGALAGCAAGAFSDD